jgi:hypothetical protein
MSLFLVVSTMLAFVSAAAGFAPTLTPVAPASMRAAPVRMGYETELGATGPLGLWDPLGLVSAAYSTPLLRIPARPCALHGGA